MQMAKLFFVYFVCSLVNLYATITLPENWEGLIDVFNSAEYKNKKMTQSLKVSTYRYNLAVCAIFKNEYAYLTEWIEYHRNLGVDHFYLYNNGSNDSFFKILGPYIRSGIVTLIDWPDRIKAQNEEMDSLWVLSTQVSAYENAIKVKAAKDTKWLVFLEVDECLVSDGGNSLVDVLEKYEEYPGIVLVSSYYNARKIDNFPNKKRMIKEVVEVVKNPKINEQRSVEKTIFKPALCTSFSWPPYKCNFKDRQEPIVLSQLELRINHYMHRYKGYLPYAMKLEKSSRE